MLKKAEEKLRVVDIKSIFRYEKVKAGIFVMLTDCEFWIYVIDPYVFAGISRTLLGLLYIYIPELEKTYELGHHPTTTAVIYWISA